MRALIGRGRLLVLTKTLKIGGLILIPVLMALGLGFGLGYFWGDKASDEVRDFLKVQAQLAVEEVDAELRVLQQEASHSEWVAESAKSLGLPPEGILYKAEVSLSVQGTPEMKWSAQNPSWVSPWSSSKNSNEQLSFVSKVFLSHPELRTSRPGSSFVFSVRPDQNGVGEWLCLVFKKMDVAGTFSMIWIDPAQYFRLFSNWYRHSESGRYRSYLLSKNGVVLAHSYASLSGLDSKSSASQDAQAILKNSKYLFDGTQKWISKRLVSFDHQEVDWIGILVGEFPLVLGLEATRPQSSSGMSGIMSGIFFSAFFLLWGVLWYVAARIRNSGLDASLRRNLMRRADGLESSEGALDFIPLESTSEGEGDAYHELHPYSHGHSRFNDESEGSGMEHSGERPPSKGKFFSEFDFLIINSTVKPGNEPKNHENT